MISIWLVNISICSKKIEVARYPFQVKISPPTQGVNWPSVDLNELLLLIEGCETCATARFGRAGHLGGKRQPDTRNGHGEPTKTYQNHVGILGSSKLWC